MIAEDGKRYAFYPRKTSASGGQILVKGPDGKRYGVTGNKHGDRFITNPSGKNASVLLSKEEKMVTVPSELPKSIHEMSEEEVKAYLESKYGPPPS